MPLIGSGSVFMITILVCDVNLEELDETCNLFANIYVGSLANRNQSNSLFLWEYLHFVPIFGLFMLLDRTSLFLMIK